MFYSKPQIEFHLQVIGFQNAGKTTILQKMKIDGGKETTDFEQAEAVPTVPTIGVQLETITFRNLDIKVWDLSGQEKLRGTWQYYYETVNGLIFVVDSTNIDQL